jgi:hypothetical protein
MSVNSLELEKKVWNSLTVLAKIKLALIHDNDKDLPQKVSGNTQSAVKIL